MFVCSDPSSRLRGVQGVLISLAILAIFCVYGLAGCRFGVLSVLPVGDFRRCGFLGLAGSGGVADCRFWGCGRFEGVDNLQLWLG